MLIVNENSGYTSHVRWNELATFQGQLKMTFGKNDFW